MAVNIGAHIAASQNQPGPATMAETFEQLHGMGVITADLAVQLKKSVSFRNIAVHNYSTINWQVVHAIIAGHMDDFKDFARAVNLWQAGSSVQAKTDHRPQHTTPQHQRVHGHASVPTISSLAQSVV